MRKPLDLQGKTFTWLKVLKTILTKTERIILCGCVSADVETK